LPDGLVQRSAVLQRTSVFWRPRESSRGAWRLVDHPARLFVCARCRAQVLLCSRCDRGQRYCGRTCSRAARHDSRREAARRYQRSRAGRMAHAARSRRWRQRRSDQARKSATSDTSATNIVTRQGSPTPVPDAPLASSEQADECTSPVPHTSPSPIVARCRRCAAVLSPWVRQGFLRHGRTSGWPARVIDPCP